MNKRRSNKRLNNLLGALSCMTHWLVIRMISPRPVDHKSQIKGNCLTHPPSSIAPVAALESTSHTLVAGLKDKAHFN